jgi:hypothetical protein
MQSAGYFSRELEASPGASKRCKAINRIFMANVIFSNKLRYRTHYKGLSYSSELVQILEDKL